jgi:hypothetical protein
MGWIPSFCTSSHERVYITAFGCEICFVLVHRIEQLYVFSLRGGAGFPEFYLVFSSCRIVVTNFVDIQSTRAKNIAESQVNSRVVTYSET